MPPVRTLRAVSELVHRLSIAFCVLCVMVMLSISFIGFFYMAATGQALSWTYSLARLFVPWIGMLSIAIAFKSGEHIAVNMLVRALPGPWALALRYASLALIGLFALLLIGFGWEFFIGSAQDYMVSDQVQIDSRWVAACVPITGLILLIHLPNGLELLEPLDPDQAIRQTIEAEG